MRCACRAALEIHTAIVDLVDEVSHRDGIDLRLRVGLNSGQVIAGEIGSRGAGYTAIGEQVGHGPADGNRLPSRRGDAQPSTARLVEPLMSLVTGELVQIKGITAAGCRPSVVGVPDRDHPVAGALSTLVGRRRELKCGRGSVTACDGTSRCGGHRGGLAGYRQEPSDAWSPYWPPRGIEVFTSTAGLHHPGAVSRGGTTASRRDRGARSGRFERRAQLQARNPGVDSTTCCCSRICWASPTPMWIAEDRCRSSAPTVDRPGERRRADPGSAGRLPSSRMCTGSIEVSESMIADFLAVIPRTRSLVLMTFRPEYRGVPARWTRTDDRPGPAHPIRRPRRW